MANTFFFDIETGGFKPSNNPILSISWAQGEEEVRSGFAKPEPGTKISRWAESKVWNKIKEQNRKLHTEQEVLERFLTQLEGAPVGTRIVGWNIGYEAVPTGISRQGGFDIPFIMARAEKYGMLERARAAFKKHTILDLGTLWSYRVAQGVTKHGHKLMKAGLLPEELYTESIGYMKKAGQLAAEGGLRTEIEIAEALQRSNVRFAGWKQELLYEVIMGKPLARAHESEADVRALREILSKGATVDEGFVRKWTEGALRWKLVNRAKFVPGTPAEAIPARYTAIMEEAEQWGIRRGVEKQLRELAQESGVSFETVQAGRGIATKERLVFAEAAAEKVARTGRRGLGTVIEEALPLLRRNWGKAALAAGAATFFLAEPGTWFSGKDDAYNTIEGLPHGGFAERMRKGLTDFGSGGVASKLLSRAASLFSGSKLKPFKQADIVGLARQAKLQSFEEFTKGVGVSLSSNKILAQGGGGVNIAPKSSWNWFAKRQGLNPVEMQKGLKEIGLEPGRAYISSNVTKDIVETMHGEAFAFVQQLKGLKDVAKEQGTTVKALLKADPVGQSYVDTFRKSFQMVTKARKFSAKTQENIGKTIAFHEATELRNVAEVTSKNLSISDDLAKQAFQHQMTLPQEELFLRSLGDKDAYAFFKQLRATVDNSFSGFDDAYNTVEGLRHGGIAEDLRKILTDFGSGWLRAASRAVKATGVTAAKIAESKGYRVVKTLEGEHWMLQKKLGAGGMGEVWQAKSLAKHGRTGVYKMVKEGREVTGPILESKGFPAGRIMAGRINKLHEAGLGKPRVKEEFESIVESLKTSKEGMVSEWKKGKFTKELHYEARMQELAHQEAPGLVPAVYGRTSEGFIQEFAGEAINEKTLPRAKEFIEKHFSKMRAGKTSMIHFDLAPANLTYKEGQFKIIDWGLAAPREAFTEAQLQTVFKGYERGIEHMKGLKPLPPSSPLNLGTLTGEATGVATGAGAAPIPLSQIPSVRDLQFSAPPGVVAGSPMNIQQMQRDAAQKAADAIKTQNFEKVYSSKIIDTDFESPVNLNKATGRAQAMMSTDGVARYPNISILESRRKVQRKRMMQAKHRESQIRSSVNARRPGKRHRQQTGSIVI